MRRIILAALTALAILAAALVPVAPATARPAGDPLVLMSVGDSISTGGPDGSYRGEMSRLLTLAGVAHSWTVHATGGISCAALAPQVQAWVAAERPNLVLLECGTNDGPMTYSAGVAFQHTYEQLITNALNGAPWHTRVAPSWIQYSAVSPNNPAPSWLATSEPIVNDAIYRAVIGSPHGSRLAPIVDFQRIPPAYLDAGGVHPTDTGYKLMGQLWYRALRVDQGWPDIMPEPCGMTGYRFGGSLPTYASISSACQSA